QKGGTEIIQGSITNAQKNKRNVIISFRFRKIGLPENGKVPKNKPQIIAVRGETTKRRIRFKMYANANDKMSMVRQIQKRRTSLNASESEKANSRSFRFFKNSTIPS